MSLINWKKDEELFPSFSSIIEDFWGKDYVKKMETSTTMPAVNVSETEEAFEVEVAAPGFKKEEFSIKLDNNLLTISSEHKEEMESEERKITRKEFNYTKFTRSFTLPDNVDRDNIDATYTDGLLKLKLLKKELTKK